MDDNNSNQYKNVFDENGCMKCCDPKWEQKQLSNNALIFCNSMI